MRKVLLVDDDPFVRRLVALTLNNQQYAILESDVGECALEITRREHPSLMLLDLVLPDMSGIEVCKQIKADPQLCETVVLVLTAQTSPARLETCRSVGADYVLTKPFSPFQLLTLTEHVFESR